MLRPFEGYDTPAIFGILRGTGRWFGLNPPERLLEMAETVKKTRTTAAKPRKAAKKTVNGAGADPAIENHHANAQERSISQEEVARLAHTYWQQRGGKHGHHVEDWFRAEQELRTRV